MILASFLLTLEMLFAVSVTSQVDVRVSTALFLQSSTISELFPVFQALCFFDHLVMVTLSSTCTSLTSDSEEWMLSSSMIGRAEGVEGEKEGLPLGDEWVLPCGLIWVAMSLLETVREISVAASLTASRCSSASLMKNQLAR